MRKHFASEKRAVTNTDVPPTSFQTPTFSPNEKGQHAFLHGNLSGNPDSQHHGYVDCLRKPSDHRNTLWDSGLHFPNPSPRPDQTRQSAQVLPQRYTSSPAGFGSKRQPCDANFDAGLVRRNSQEITGSWYCNCS